MKPLLPLLAVLALSSSALALAQPIRIGELNSYKVFPAFLEPYKKGIGGNGGCLPCRTRHAGIALRTACACADAERHEHFRLFKKRCTPGNGILAAHASVLAARLAMAADAG